jgi:cobalt-zinc-cadmium efflux system membrane fusion protein
MKNIFYLLLILNVVACKESNESTNAGAESVVLEDELTLTAKQADAAKIETNLLVEKEISSVIKLNGKIDVPPQNMVSISMPLGGYLKSSKLLPGMHINKGEIIATMEDQQYIQLQQDYLTAQSKLKFAKSDFERQKELNGTKASSDKVFQQAQMEFNNQQINVNALIEKLKLIYINPSNLNENNLSKAINIYSPIDGFVSHVNVNIGKYVNPTDVLFELVNPTDIHLNIKVFEKDLDKLAIGQKVIAYNNFNPSIKHICEIILISKDLGLDRSAEVHCHFLEYDKALLPGMYMNAEIEINMKKSMVIHEDAIVNFEAKDYIFIAEVNNKFKMFPVETDVQENEFITIKNPSNLIGKNIVTKGAYTLLMALKNKSED